jgi:PAS domain S-box-containing protein
MPDRIVVSAADFVRNIGAWQEQALKVPVSITHHGRERLVLLSSEQYARANTESLGATPAAQAALLALEHSQEGYIAYGEELTIVDLNQKAEAYFGVSRESLVGRRLMDVFPSVEGSFAAEQLRRTAQTRTTTTFETDSPVFSGVRIAVKTFPLLNGTGVLFSNITEREAQRLAAARAQALLTGLSVHRDVAVIQLDVRGRFLRLDDKFPLWCGFDPSALLNCRLVDLLLPSDRRRVADVFDEAVLSRKAGAVDAALVTKALQERRTSLSFAPVEDADARLEIWTVLSLGTAVAKNQSAA